MKKLSQRVAALTPSITAGLILFAVALTGLLAYRAFDASRAQQQTIEHTLQDYAGFAAFQLKNATVNRIVGQRLGVFDALVRSVSARGAMPPVGPEGAAALIEERSRVCRCLDVAFYYQLTYADSGIVAGNSTLATPENLRRIRDTVIAQPLGPSRAQPGYPNMAATRSNGTRVASQYLETIFSRLGQRAFLFTQVVNLDASGRRAVAYGFAEPADLVVGHAVTAVLKSQPVLPITLTRRLNVDSIIAVTVRNSEREVVFESNESVPRLFAASDSLEQRFSGLHFLVAIDPAAAGQLIIGGLPRSRLPEVLATTFVAVALLGLLLYQFRRQEELGRLRNDFVSGVSHELRTPLAQIRLLAELLRMGKVPTEERRERSLRIIDQEARRLSFLVESILSFTGSRSGQLSLVTTDVASEIDEIVAGFEPLAQAQGVRITTQLERGIAADVDRGALRQVLLNLLDNAVRYGPPRQHVTITTAAANGSWTLEVADEGPGIPAEECDRIFAPYYRMKRDAGGAVGGTGIGLAVVSRLVKEHGGRVHVAPANRNGAAGARFIVTLPISAERDDMARAAAPRTVAPQVSTQ